MSFRIEFDFHAANNEGAGGTNVMEPRRITVGDKEHDGISGEMIRRHVLENFVKLCQRDNVALHNRCKGLVPDRGREDLKSWMLKNAKDLPTKKVREKNISVLDPQHYPSTTQELVKNCALCDVGGFLIALEEADGVLGVLKRDSCFEAGWLVSEHPAIVDYTQHSAYDPNPEKHNLFVQNLRVGIYGGVFRIDLDRVGRNDWWWLNTKSSSNKNGFEEYSVELNERNKRIRLLLKGIREWLISPSFAKQTGWLQHQSGLLEGSIVLSKDGSAPFVSPVKFMLDNGRPTIGKNDNYRKTLSDIAGSSKYNCEKFDFNSPTELIEEMDKILKKFEGNQNQAKT